MSKAATLANIPSYSFMRNRIINGDMRIDQRNGGNTINASAGGYTVDRWIHFTTQSGRFNIQQNAAAVTPPAGFTNYLGLTSVGATIIGASDALTLVQSIEGLNVADLGFGTANAVPITLSFWVRSSLTGTFGGSFRNNGNTRSYPFTFTISAANTWEYKTLTVPGDTSGTWLTNNGIGLQLAFGLGVGSTFSGTAGSWAGSNFNSATGAVSVAAVSGATFYLTGVQLEAGSIATPFERRMFGQELLLCQRYYQTIRAINGGSGSTTTNVYTNIQHSEMRTTPVVGVTGALVFTDPGVAAYTQSNPDVILAGGSSPAGSFVMFRNLSGMNTFRVIMLNTMSTFVVLNAEL